MIEVSKRLYVGSLDDFHHQDAEAVVSATKTVHRRFIHARKEHPEYIVAERGSHLMLNWVDGPARLYEWSGPETFTRSLDFIQKHLVAGDRVLVHCDQGVSRSPTLALLYLAKRERSISNASFQAAAADFSALYPRYNPAGIADYVAEHWRKIT